MSYIFLCATDAGGARNISPLLSLVSLEELKPLLITTQSLKHFFDLNSCGSECICLSDTSDIASIVNLFCSRPVKAVIAGTTRYYSPDRELVLQARNNNVRSVVVVDEWYSFRDRFEDKNNHKFTYLPDVICFPDKIALDEAISDGLPEDRCFVTGSPALAALSQTAEEWMATPPPIPEIVRNFHEWNVVTFLSETYAKDFGVEINSPGILGSFKGYTEKTVLEDISEVLYRLGEPSILIEKLHPADHADANSGVWINDNIFWQKVKDIDLWPLLWHSDIVIGMQSMALLEAHILGCEVVSYQPDLLGLDTCTAVRLGLIQRLDNKTQLKQWCSSRLTTKSTERNFKKLACAHSQAGNNILHLALGTNDYEN